MRKLTFCICENKDADQLRGDREADQRLCFRYLDSIIPLPPKYKISSLQPSPVAVQPGLCQTWSESTLLVFSRCGSNMDNYKVHVQSLPGKLNSSGFIDVPVTTLSESAASSAASWAALISFSSCVMVSSF